MDINVFLEDKPKGIFGYVIGLIFLCFILVVVMFKMRIYDSKVYLTTVKDNLWEINVLTEDIEFIKLSEYVELENNKYSFEIIEIHEEQIDYINNLSFKMVTFKIDSYQVLDNYSVNIKFRGNKERAIKKIINLFI